MIITCKDTSQSKGTCLCDAGKAFESSEGLHDDTSIVNYEYNCTVDDNMFPEQMSGLVSKVYFYIEESPSSILPVFLVVYLFNDNYSEYFNIQTCLNVEIKSFDIAATFDTTYLQGTDFTLVYEYPKETSVNESVLHFLQVCC